MLLVWRDIHKRDIYATVRTSVGKMFKEGPRSTEYRACDRGRIMGTKKI